jgi:hypothetical protein
MKLAKFDFECQWSRDAYLPPFPGSMLRGALGHSLKKVVCALRNQRCDTCLLNRQCLYARIFENKSTTTENLNLASLPHPYVIGWHPELARSYRKGEYFRFSLVLMGAFVETLPYFVYAVDRMGEEGLGKADDTGKRNQMALAKVLYDDRILYSREKPELPAEIPCQKVSLEPAEPSEKIEQVQLNLITPLRVKQNGKFTKDLDFPLLISSITRRLEGLWHCYGSHPITFDRNTLMSQARQITTTASNLRWQDQPRYSNRQASEMQLGGVLGTIAFEGDITPLLPMLKAAEQVHIGKATSFGLGKVQMKRPNL